MALTISSCLLFEPHCSLVANPLFSNGKSLASRSVIARAQGAAVLERERVQDLKASPLEQLQAGAVDRDKFRAYSEATQQLAVLTDCRNELLQFLEEVKVDMDNASILPNSIEVPLPDDNRKERKLQRAAKRAQRKTNKDIPTNSTAQLVTAPSVSLEDIRKGKALGAPVTAPELTPLLQEESQKSLSFEFSSSSFNWRMPDQTSLDTAGPLQFESSNNLVDAKARASRRASNYKSNRAAVEVPAKQSKNMKFSSGDATSHILKVMSTTDLVSAEEEKVLTTMVKDLIFLERVKAELEAMNGRAISKAEWAQAVNMGTEDFEARYNLGVTARSRMFKANHRLVVSVCKKYLNRGSTLQDLIAEGLQGLLRGIEKFEPTKGFRFSTYAHWWIRQAVTRSLTDQSRTIRLPVHMFENLQKVRSMKSTLTEELGREPTLEELAAAMGQTPKKLNDLFAALRTPTSTDALAYGDKGNSVGDMIEDDDQMDADSQMEADLSKKDVSDILSVLCEREAHVIKLRYGLSRETEEEMTLEEIGKRIGVTRERVRQIESKALAKLRALNAEGSGKAIMEFANSSTLKPQLAQRSSQGLRKT